MKHLLQADVFVHDTYVTFGSEVSWASIAAGAVALLIIVGLSVFVARWLRKEE